MWVFHISHHRTRVTNSVFSRGSGSDRSCVEQSLDNAGGWHTVIVDLAATPIRFFVEPIGYTALVAGFMGIQWRYVSIALFIAILYRVSLSIVLSSSNSDLAVKN
jgi:hypothetical protein